MMRRGFHSAWLLALVLLAGCAASNGAATPTRTAASATVVDPNAVGSAPIKTITIGQTGAITTFSSAGFDNGSGGRASMTEVHTEGLVSANADGAFEPRLALSLPVLDDGSLVFLPDGRMQTTWKLRDGVLWHDGVPLTADDLVFSWRVAAATDAGVTGSQGL